jgi:hypothetical protein
MLKQPPAAPPGIEPNEPIGGNVNDRVRQLETPLDQTIDRLRYAPPYDYSYYPNYYGATTPPSTIRRSTTTRSTETTTTIISRT